MIKVTFSVTLKNLLVYYVEHREIKEERKSGKIIGEISIGPKRYNCAV